MLYTLAGVLVITGLWFIACYNGLIARLETVRNNEKQIDIQLDRRFKVFESLLSTVKKYMDYEKTALVDIIKLRQQAVQAKSEDNVIARREAEDGLSKFASNLNVNFENYPNLRASEEFLHLQEEIVNTENRLSYAKQAFNDSIERYNVMKNSLLQSIVVKMFPSKLNVEFHYWELPKESILEKENYSVKF